MFAILLALGMLVISAQPTDLATPDTAAAIADTDELPPAIVIQAPTADFERRATEVSPPPHVASFGRRHDPDLFRPPRVVAFV
jgi:hypothetical protein